MVLLDHNEISFPNPELYESESGLVAIGGDLSPKRLWLAYRFGAFPWFNEGEKILWWCPNPRFILYPYELKISKSMNKIIKEDVFTFSENKCFERVMRNCKTAFRKNQNGTWISDELIVSFKKLHQAGIAKSFEVWQKDELVGGFYGIQIGRVFCGESMFSKVSNASKAGFINFISNQKENIELIDCQIYSEHLESLGARMISKKEYLKILKKQKL